MTDKLQLKQLNSAYLSTAKLTTEELKQRLRKLADYLSGLDQDVNTSSLDEIAASLVQTSILKHKNNDIQLLAACCLADIIQIYVPNAPYDDDQLQSVFKLFIKQLQGLENIQKDKDVDENAKRLTYLLEKLALVKAFVLVVEEEKLVVKLFDTFFKAIRPLHANLIVIHMLDIMVSCLEEMEVIHASVLEVIFSNLLAGKENSSAKMMAQTLIHRAADKLQPFVTKFLNDLLVEGKSSETDLSSRAYELIFELNFVNASLLLYVLPQLDNQLKVEDLETRSSAVQLLARMFAAKDSTLPSSYPHLFSAFLGRFKDINPDIRIVMVQFAEHFIVNQADDKLLNSVTAELKAKVADPKEEVRAAAVTSLGKAIRSMNITRVGAALTGRTSWLTALIHDATLRLRDRNASVRHAASDALAALWGHARAHWSANAITKSHVDGLPSAVLSLFLLPEAEDKCRAERAVVTMVNSAQSDAHTEDVSPTKKKSKSAVHKQRVSTLLALLISLDERGSQALNIMLRDKRAFIDEFKSYLSMRKEHANTDTLAKKAAFLAARLPGSVEKFKSTVDDGKEKMMRSFETLLDASSSTKQVAAARDYLLNGEPEKGKKKRKVSAYVAEIVNKLSMDLIQQDDVPHLFEALSEVNREDEVKVLKFLEVLAASFPHFFTNSFDTLTELLGSDIDEMVDNALRMLTNIGKVIGDVEEDNLSQMVSDVQKKLSALCSQGTPVQAKYAVRALQYVSKNAANSNSKLFKDLIAKLSDKKDGKQATILRALAELCVRAADKVQDEVIDVAQQVLLKTWKGNNSAESKCLAIALLRNYFLIRAEPTGKSKKAKKDEADPQAVKFVDQLFDLIEGDSALLTGAKDDDKTQVRTAAATAVLKLARQKRYDTLVTLERYQQLAQLIVSGESELRGELLEKLYKGLRGVNQLPLRYLAYFALYGNDREHVVKAKKYFAACVQTRRQFLKQNQDQFVQEPEDEDEETDGKKSVPNAVKVIMRVMPEYSLPWTVHLLAHLPYFEEDKPSYTVTVKYLNMWMETVLRGSSTTAGNRSLVRQALVDIRQTNDAQDADNHNVQTVAELAYRMLNENYAITAVQDKQANMETFYLPQTLFTMPEKLLSLSQTFLPDDYHLPAGKNKIQQLLAETDKKKGKESDEEQSDDQLEDKRQKNKKKKDDDSVSEVRPKGKKRKATEEPEEAESRPKSKSKRAEETPAKGKKKAKADEEENGEEAEEETNTRTKGKKSKKAEPVEEEEQEEPQPRGKAKKNKKAEPVDEEQEEPEPKGKKGTKSKKAEAVEQDEPEAKQTSAAKGKKGKKSAAEESPRKGKKNKTEPEEEQADEPKPNKKQNKSKTADKKSKAEESDPSPNKKRKRAASEEEDQEEPEITHKRKQRKTSK